MLGTSIDFHQLHEVPASRPSQVPTPWKLWNHPASEASTRALGPWWVASWPVVECCCTCLGFGKTWWPFLQTKKRSGCPCMKLRLVSTLFQRALHPLGWRDSVLRAIFLVRRSQRLCEVGTVLEHCGLNRTIFFLWTVLDSKQKRLVQFWMQKSRSNPYKVPHFLACVHN